MAGDRPSQSTTSESPSDFIHPETGELLATPEAWKAALDAAEQKLGERYRVIWALRNGMAERMEPAELPARRYRSDTQEKVARCPRCGTRLEEKDASNDSPQ